MHRRKKTEMAKKEPTAHPPSRIAQVRSPVGVQGRRALRSLTDGGDRARFGPKAQAKGRPRQGQQLPAKTIWSDASEASGSVRKRPEASGG
jgi:hypothetical protein